MQNSPMDVHANKGIKSVAVDKFEWLARSQIPRVLIPKEFEIENKLPFVSMISPLFYPGFELLYLTCKLAIFVLFLILRA